MVGKPKVRLNVHEGLVTSSYLVGSPCFSVVLTLGFGPYSAPVVPKLFQLGATKLLLYSARCAVVSGCSQVFAKLTKTHSSSSGKSLRTHKMSASLSDSEPTDSRPF